MKMIQAFFLILACQGIFSFRMNQLFDFLSNGNRKKENRNIPSLFEKTTQSDTNSHHSTANKELHGLFDSLHFNQLREKTLNKKASLFDQVRAQANTESNSNSNSIFKPSLFSQAESEATAASKSSAVSRLSAGKVEAKSQVSSNNQMHSTTAIKTSSQSKAKEMERSHAQSLLQKNQKEISQLKSKINSLVKTNNFLQKKMTALGAKASKARKMDDDVVTFIQKYDHDVNALRSNIESSKNIVETKILERENEMRKLYKHHWKSLSDMESSMDNINKRIENIQNSEAEKINEMKSHLEVKNLEVEDSLTVNGVALTKKLFAHAMDLGKIKIEPNGILFSDDNVKIAVGANVMTVGSLMRIVESMGKIISICGQEFEKCLSLPEKTLQIQERREKDILQNLKDLRKETTKILKRRK